MGALYSMSFPSRKQYIGITTKTSEERFASHWGNRNCRNFPLYHALRKYGKESVKLDTIFECDDWEMLCLLESEFIAGRKTISPRGYNVTYGGDGIPVHSPEQKRKMTEALDKRRGSVSEQFKILFQDSEYRKRNKDQLLSQQQCVKRRNKVSRLLTLRYSDPNERKKAGEYSRGEKNVHTKFVEQDIYDIRARLANGETQKSVADSYGVHKTTISHIHLRKNWGWLNDAHNR